MTRRFADALAASLVSLIIGILIGVAMARGVELVF